MEIPHQIPAEPVTVEVKEATQEQEKPEGVEILEATIEQDPSDVVTYTVTGEQLKPGSSEPKPVKATVVMFYKDFLSEEPVPTVEMQQLIKNLALHEEQTVTVLIRPLMVKDPTDPESQRRVPSTERFEGVIVRPIN